MKPQSDQPYSLHSICSRTRARSARVGVAEVGLGPGLDLLGREVALGGGVAELEAGVVVAGVLVVDQPTAAVAVVDEVGGQQVVVARHRRPRRDGAAHVVRRPRRRRGRRRSRGSAEAALLHGREVRRLPREHVEVAGERAARRAAAGRRRRPAPAPRRRRSRRSRARVPGEEADHQHRRGRAGTPRTSAPTPASAAAAVLACSASRSMPEQPGVALATSARPGRAAAVVVGGHAEVGVGQPAGQVLDAPGPPRQAGEAVQVGGTSATRSVVERLDDRLVDGVLRAR